MIDELLPAIEAANLPATLYRTAIRIAAHTDSNGIARLEWSEMLELAQTESKETARGQLDRLIAAKVFECKRNHNVLVIWKLQPGDERETRRFTSPDGESYAKRVGLRTGADRESSAKRVGLPVNQGESYAKRVGLLVPPVGKDLTTGRKEGKGDPTYLPSSEGSGEPQPPQPDAAAQPLTDQERSLDLLLDPAVGVDVTFATYLASRYPFDQIRRQVLRALRDLDSGAVKSIGVIKHRLSVGAAAIVTDADRATELWARHATAEDALEERRRKYSLESDDEAARRRKFARDEDTEDARRRKYVPAEYADVIIS